MQVTIVCFVFFLRWRGCFSASVAFAGFLLTGGSILLQSSHYLLRLPFGTSAAIQPGAEARDTGSSCSRLKTPAPRQPAGAHDRISHSCHFHRSLMITVPVGS